MISAVRESTQAHSTPLTAASARARAARRARFGWGPGALGAHGIGSAYSRRARSRAVSALADVTPFMRSSRTRSSADAREICFGPEWESREPYRSLARADATSSRRSATHAQGHFSARSIGSSSRRESDALRGALSEREPATARPPNNDANREQEIFQGRSESSLRLSTSLPRVPAPFGDWDNS
jgi:hypothetical protein